jgi:hypothetical protein
MKAKKLTKAREDAHKARAAKNRAAVDMKKARKELATAQHALRLICSWADLGGIKFVEKEAALKEIRSLCGKALGYE